LRFSESLSLHALHQARRAGAKPKRSRPSIPLRWFPWRPCGSPQRRGFFKKKCLDVRLVFIASGPLGTTAILSGEVDVGIIGGFAPTRAITGGAKNLVMIGQSKNRMTGAIVGKKEIASVQDLKGKRLGI